MAIPPNSRMIAIRNLTRMLHFCLFFRSSSGSKRREGRRGRREHLREGSVQPFDLKVSWFLFRGRGWISNSDSVQEWDRYHGLCSSLLCSFFPVNHVYWDLGFFPWSSRTDSCTAFRGRKVTQGSPSPAAPSGSLSLCSNTRTFLCSSRLWWGVGGTEVDCHCFGVTSQIWGQMAHMHLVITNLIFTFLLLELGYNASGLLQNWNPGQFREGCL